MIIAIDAARPTVKVWFPGRATSFIETIVGNDFHGLENPFGIGISQDPASFDTTGNDSDSSSDEDEKEHDEKPAKKGQRVNVSSTFFFFRPHISSCIYLPGRQAAQSRCVASQNHDWPAPAQDRTFLPFLQVAAGIPCAAKRHCFRRDVGPSRMPADRLVLLRE